MDFVGTPRVAAIDGVTRLDRSDGSLLGDRGLRSQEVERIENVIEEPRSSAK